MICRTVWPLPFSFGGLGYPDATSQADIAYVRHFAALGHYKLHLESRPHTVLI
jgi:hypothetical protein